MQEKEQFRWKVNYSNNTLHNTDYTELMAVSDNYIIRINFSTYTTQRERTVNLYIDRKYQDTPQQMKESIEYKFPIITVDGMPPRDEPVYPLFFLGDTIRDVKQKTLSELQFYDIERGNKVIAEKLRFLEKLYYTVTGEDITPLEIQKNIMEQ